MKRATKVGDMAAIERKLEEVMHAVIVFSVQDNWSDVQNYRKKQANIWHLGTTRALFIGSCQRFPIN